MQISLPKEPKVKKIDTFKSVFEIENCYPSYGVTLGNALRRVLLSSLPGAAIVGVKMKGVQHEFSTIDYVAEDVIDIILNLKKIRFKLIGEEGVKVGLKVKGKKEVTAADIKLPGNLEVINKEQHIASLSDKKAELDMEIEIEKGLGFVPIENRKKDKLEIGMLAVDAIYTPIRQVNFDVENMRVGDKTDFNKLVVTIETDGSIKPEEAFEKAAGILVEQFNVFGKLQLEDEVVDESKKEDKKENKEKKGKTISGDLKKEIEEIKELSTRTVNALQGSGIKTLAGLLKKNKGFFGSVEGLGDKGIKEISRVFKKQGFELKD